MSRRNKELEQLPEELQTNAKALYILREYINYVKNFKEEHKDEYNEIYKKFEENNRLVDVALEGFDIVKFVAVEGDLNLCIEKDGEQVEFSIQHLYDKDQDDYIINKFKEYIKEEQEEVDRLTDKENLIKKTIAELKPASPKKILGIFVDLRDRERCKQVYYTKLKKLKSKLTDLIEEKDMMQYQIDSKSQSVFEWEAVNEFIASLTPQQMSAIKSKHYEVSEIYEIDRLYQFKLEALNSKILSLSKFVEKNTKQEAKYVLFELVKFLYYSYRHLPDEKKHLHFAELGEYYNFGKYKEEMIVLGKAMEDQQFGKMSRYNIAEIEREIIKARDEQELLEQQNELDK